MPVAKVDNAVHISPHDKRDVKFSMNILYKIPCLNILAADVFNLNEICSSSDKLRHIHFHPNLDHGKIGALLGLNSFLFTYSLHVIEGNNFIPSAVQTKFGWTLAGENQLNKNRQQRHSLKTKHRPFVFHVTCNKTTEQPLDYLLQQFCKIEENGISTLNKNYSSDDKLALQILDNTTRLVNGRYEIGLPWKPNSSLSNNYCVALKQLQLLQKRLEKTPIYKIYTKRR